MIKNLKKIVAVALVFGAFSGFAPLNSINPLITKAYAANSNKYLDSLNLYDEDGDNIKLYEKTDYTGRVDEDEVEDGEIYYAKTSSDTINIETNGVSDDYVRVFRGTSDTSRGKETSEDIKLDSDSSSTTFVVKVFGEDPGDNVRYKDCDNYDVLSTYRIKVKHVADDDTTKDNGEDDNSDDYDDIYLDRLSVDGTVINLSKSVVKYTYNVPSDVSQVTVRATPQDDYDVSINGDDVDEDDKYKATVDLNKGENKIKIDIQDDDDERVYTLTINRGEVSGATGNTNTSGSATDNSGVKNQWVLVNGKWQYKDAAGNAVKNTWVGNYFVQSDGNMATGWINYGGKYYYLGYDGAKKSGWQAVNNAWYYLDSQGIMQTGWILDKSGKYYYLYTNGAMAYNTTVGGYRLGNDGAWIK